MSEGFREKVREILRWYGDRALPLFASGDYTPIETALTNITAIKDAEVADLQRTVERLSQTLREMRGFASPEFQSAIDAALATKESGV